MARWDKTNGVQAAREVLMQRREDEKRISPTEKRVVGKSGPVTWVVTGNRRHHGVVSSGPGISKYNQMLFDTMFKKWSE